VKATLVVDHRPRRLIGRGAAGARSPSTWFRCSRGSTNLAILGTRTSNGDEPVRARILIPLLVALTVAGCGSGGHDGGAPRKDGTQLYALLASNELVGVALSPARLTVRLRLGEGLDQASPGRLLATSPDGTTVYVLVRHSKRPSIAVVAGASGHLRMRVPLPAGLGVRSLVVGARSGTLYVLGNREGTRRNEVQGLESSAQLLVVDPDAGRVRKSIEIRPLEGRDWWVYSAAVAADERTLYVTYHGSDTTGADWIALPELRRCRRSPQPWAGCLPADLHGHLLPLAAGGFVAATGSPRLVRYDAARRLELKLDTQLAGNHLMDFAVNKGEDKLAAVGSCVYRPGLALLDLRAGESRVSTDERHVCGERIVFAGNALVVGRNAETVASTRPGKILVVNPASGAIAGSVRTPAEVVDLLALG
jgi:hypothetical protein